MSRLPTHGEAMVILERDGQRSEVQPHGTKTFLGYGPLTRSFCGAESEVTSALSACTFYKGDW